MANIDYTKLVSSATYNNLLLFLEGNVNVTQVKKYLLDNNINMNFGGIYYDTDRYSFGDVAYASHNRKIFRYAVKKGYFSMKHWSWAAFVWYGVTFLVESNIVSPYLVDYHGERFEEAHVGSLTNEDMLLIKRYIHRWHNKVRREVLFFMVL